MIVTIPYVYEFDLQRDDWSRSDISAIDSPNKFGIVKLKYDDIDGYPEGGVHTVTMKRITVTRAKSIVGVMPVVKNASIEGTVVTSVTYRVLNDGSEYYWDGASWVVAADSEEDWCTLTELQSNISSFQLAAKEIGFVARLHTSDRRVTPSITSLTVALDVDVRSWVEEYIVNGLIPVLREKIRPVHDWSLVWPGGSSVDLSSYKPENGMVISEFVEAYDHSVDPDHENDLLDSYENGVLTLTSSVSEGTRLWVGIIPEILYAISTQHDFSDTARIPSVTVRSYEQTATHEMPKREVVVDYDNGTAVVVPSPRAVTYYLPLDVKETSLTAIARIGEAIKAFVIRNRVIRIDGLGVDVNLELGTADVKYYPRGREDGIQRGVIEIHLRNCLEWNYPKTTGHVIERLVIE